MSEKMTVVQALDRLKSIYLNRDGSYTVGHKFLYEFEVISAELESLRRDAERYLFLRDKWWLAGDSDDVLSITDRIISIQSPDKRDKFDAAIDAALEADNGRHD